MISRLLLLLSCKTLLVATTANAIRRPRSFQITMSSAFGTVPASRTSTSRNVLLISSSADAASLNIANALKDTMTWQRPLTDIPLFLGPDDLNCCLWLWDQEEPLLHLNFPDKTVQQMLATSSSIHSTVTFDEVMFLSKHSAASGKASLTVHPIGIPWVGGNDPGPYGGIPGRCSPPNARIASIYRALLKQAADKQMKDQFNVTMEATHHGPQVDVPTCFIEIGSTENEWSIPELGQFWAQLLTEHFRDTNVATDNGGSGGVVVMSIGGGHYVPKLNDAARFGEGLLTGHALATYSLQEHLDGTVALPVDGGWQGIVREAVQSTQIAHPTAKLICLVDKKAFGAEKRKAVTSYLEELGVVWTSQLSDVRKLYDETVVASVRMAQPIT